MTADKGPRDQPLPPVSDVPVFVTRVSLKVLGTFLALLDGRPVAVATPVARFVALLTVRDEPLTRSTISSVLWPDLPDDRAAAAVRNTLWRCHTTFPNVIVNAERHVWLAPDVDVDLRRLRRTVAMLRNGGDHFSGWTVDDFVGGLLADWDEGWIISERERTRQQCLHALETICRHEVLAGHTSDGIDAGLAAVSIDPLRESAQRVLIAAYLAECNLSEARRQLDRYGRLLQDELGLEPSRSLRDLVFGFDQPVIS